LALDIKPGLLALKSKLEVIKKNIQEGSQEFFTVLGFLAQLDNDWFATKLLPQTKLTYIGLDALVDNLQQSTTYAAALSVKSLKTGWLKAS
jgi:hypothetical protein